ncbi:hypothetical protein [Paraferrimonas sedimenticola]|uniref:Uncharacterized protein n=1 Tax=Paraferrimonas sedimenticola TaxID=375674 RepID=A0AA37RUC9_9GAMM|nr:hypothetical protein [Paraferrimonas sedimenticola]GLP95009.1 hypothetical protein GCM10007895_03150 [Paraferrimonas sedimenticola]
MSDKGFNLMVWGPVDGNPHADAPRDAEKADRTKAAKDYRFLYDHKVIRFSKSDNQLLVSFRFDERTAGRYQFRWVNARPGRGGNPWDSGDGIRLQLLSMTPNELKLEIDPTVHPEGHPNTRKAHIHFDVWVKDTWPNDNGETVHFRCDPEVIVED